jgi:hypothetical protein
MSNSLKKAVVLFTHGSKDGIYISFAQAPFVKPYVSCLVAIDSPTKFFPCLPVLQLHMHPSIWPFLSLVADFLVPTLSSGSYMYDYLGIKDP